MDLTYGAASIRETATGHHIRYQEYSNRVERTGKCPLCGKRRKRSTTFTGTVSPFNCVAGTDQPKTPTQVLADLREQGAKWAPDFSCQDHEPAEVCAAAGHTERSAYGRCRRCRESIPA